MADFHKRKNKKRTTAQAVYDFFDSIEDQSRVWFSHRPILYAFVGGIGIVLFWRGVWHTADMLMDYAFPIITDSTISHVGGWPWWDGPLSMLAGSLILLFTGVFVSEFIHDEIVLSGLRREKKLVEKTEKEVEDELRDLNRIEKKLDSIYEHLKKVDTRIDKSHD